MVKLTVTVGSVEVHDLIATVPDVMLLMHFKLTLTVHHAHIGTAQKKGSIDDRHK